MLLSELRTKGVITSFSRDKTSKRLFAMGYREGDTVEFILQRGGLKEFRIGETLVAMKDCGEISVRTSNINDCGIIK